MKSTVAEHNIKHA